MRANSVITAHLRETESQLTPLHPHRPTALCQADPGLCSRQVPVELLHWVVENFVCAGEDDLGGPLSDRRLLNLRWALFSAGLGAILRCRWIWRPLGLPLHKAGSREAAGGAETQA